MIAKEESKRGRKVPVDVLKERAEAAMQKYKDALEKQKREEKEAEEAKFVVLGRALAAEAAENESFKDQVTPILETRVKKAADRKLLGLRPRRK